MRWGIGLNPLVQAASPLLVLAGQLRGSRSQVDVAGLRRHTIDGMRRFEEQARAVGIPHETVMAARYVLCASLDEAVLSTPWGAESEWVQHPLLVALHREAWGGEKFFEMLGRISLDPEKYIDLMALQYLCLVFGFAGKYQALPRGYEQLAEVQQALYRKIRTYRTPPEDELSLRWRGVQDRRNPVVRYVPWWVVASAVVTILLLVFTGYYANLASYSEPVLAELAKIGMEEFVTPPAPMPVHGPTLKELLAPQEQAGLLTVDENGSRSVVTMLGNELFASGSAEVSSQAVGMLQAIAVALDKVPGRVTVVGHTDDQPIRSLQFQNNVALSRARATNVTALQQATVDRRLRLTTRGAGASEPRYRPASTPENRARNRRVEIIHVRDTDS
jgi:type VI secretion system protein ImpK